MTTPEAGHTPGTVPQAATDAGIPHAEVLGLEAVATGPGEFAAQTEALHKPTATEATRRQGSGVVASALSPGQRASSLAFHTGSPGPGSLFS